jgi:hypothetical protein
VKAINKQYAAFCRRWEAHRFAEQSDFRKPGAEIKRVGEVVATLRVLYEETRNPCYNDAVRDIEERGIGRGAKLAWRRAFARHVKDVCLARMAHLLRKAKEDADEDAGENADEAPPVRVAAARTAAEFHVPGRSFDGVVKRIERAWRAEVRRGRVVGPAARGWPDQ